MKEREKIKRDYTEKLEKLIKLGYNIDELLQNK